jgi:hypothetical protein
LGNEVLPPMQCPDTPERWLAAMRAVLTAAPSGVSDAAVKRAVHVFANQPSGSYDDGAEERLMRAVLEDFAAQPQPGRDRGMTDCPVPHSKFDPCHNCEPVDWDGTEAHLNYRHQQDKKEK